VLNELDTTLTELTEHLMGGPSSQDKAQAAAAAKSAAMPQAA
jgi:hypothetical protein